MTGKAILIRNKQLAAWWATVAHDERFEEVCSLARAEMFEGEPTPERVKGANELISTLVQFSENDETPRPFPNPGLVHQMPEKSNPQPKTT